MPDSEAPLSLDLFAGPEAGISHLRCGSEAPLPHAAANAFAAYAEARASGAAGRARLESAREEVRDKVAALLNVPNEAGRIAFTSGAGAALDVVARNIDWREGDEVLTLREEYPSVVLAWHGLRSRGVVTRMVAGGEDPEAALLEAVTPRTRLVCVSQVGWRTSLRLDVARLSAGLRPRGVLLAVDASHALGVLPVDASLCDAVVSCGHKFLLGLHGTGILYWAHEPRPAASQAALGWYGVQGFRVEDGQPVFDLKPDATALEPGNPAFVCLLALKESLGLLEAAGTARIAAHAHGLAAALREEVERRGIPCLTPRDAERHGTSIAIPDPAGSQLFQALEAAGVLAAHGEGRLRLTFHGYNTEHDLARVLAVFDREGLTQR